MAARFTHPSTVVVAALEMELPTFWGGPVLFTGVGKVRAATALSKYLALNPHIERVINYGTAGGIKGVTKGHLYPVNKFIESDFRSCAINLPHKDLVEVTPWIAGTEFFCCSTQDHFVTDPTELDEAPFGDQVNLVDMESYALAFVCLQHGVEFICYKYVSDDADHKAADEWIENVNGGEDQFKEMLTKYQGYQCN